MGLGCEPGLLAHKPELFGLGHSLQDEIGQRGVIFHGEMPAFPPGLHPLAVARDIGDQGRETAGKCFHQRDRGAIALRSAYVEIRGPEDFGKLGLTELTRHVHSIQDAVFRKYV